MVTDVHGVGEVVISGEWRQKSLCAQRWCANVWVINCEESKLSWKGIFKKRKKIFRGAFSKRIDA